MLSESRKAAARPSLGAAVFLSLCLLGLWQASRWRFVCDDAYIAFRYAKHWAETGVASYNLVDPPGVQGFTSPLWVALLALGQRVGAGMQASALLLNALGSLLLGGAALALAGSQARDEAGPAAGLRAVLLCLAAMALCPEFLVWSSGGLETSFAASLGVLAVLALARRRIHAFHVLGAISACARLDSLVWIFAFTLVERGLNRTGGIGSHRRSLKTISALAWCMPLVVLLVQYQVYGSLFPQTFAVKRGGWALAQAFGWPYLEQWLVQGGMALGLLVALCTPKVHAAGVALVLANLGYAFWVGGDFMGYSRFLLPATVLVLAMASVTLARLSVSADPRKRWLGFVVVIMAVGTLALRVPQRWQKDQDEAWLDRRYESVHAMERFAAIRLAAGEAYAQRWPKATRVTVGAAGAFAYAASLQAFDAYGLTDPTVLERGGYYPKARPGHRWVGRRRWAKAHRPHLRCEIGWVGEGFPSNADLRARKPLTTQAGWTCKNTGPVHLRTQARPLPAQHYCCVRERFSGTEPRQK